MVLLIGRYEHSLDSKNRVSLPAKFREALSREKGRSCYLTSGLEGCLYLFLPSQWQRLLETDLQSFTLPNKEEERAFKRKFFSEATEAELDSAGRILIPQYLKAHAGLKGQLLLQGAGKRAEIWDSGRWKSYHRSRVEPALRKVSKQIEI
ncbi:MAG: division/cell wall cluster transcriptional repressor MraZ [Elusimicrobia bacterium]|nr:division/cell wall cluster transcriptional repressor MraZ [Elusimicrobiota bacterium]